MGNVSDKSCRENRNTYFVFSFCFLNRAVYEIMWKNIVESDRLQMTIWRTRIACRIPMATSAHFIIIIIIIIYHALIRSLQGYKPIGYGTC